MISYFYCTVCHIIEEVSCATIDITHRHMLTSYKLEEITKEQADAIINETAMEERWK